MPKKPLKTVCLSCARNCLSDRRLVAYIRTRNSTDTCDCRTSGICKCSWSPLRGEFDRIVGEDQCIGPNQVRPLLKTLRVPYPVDSADVENCLLQIAEGREDLDTPRITAIAFEKWYRRYFDEQGANLDDEKSVASATSKGSFTSK